MTEPSVSHFKAKGKAMKKQRWTTVFEKESIWLDIPKNPNEFIAYFKEKIDLIPKEFLDSAKIELYMDADYGDGIISLRIGYSRPETEKEESDRRISEKTDRKKRNDFVKKNELNQLKLLKEKYPNE